MSASLTRKEDCVDVVIDGEFGYAVWQTLRDARVAARDARLPLRIDISHCERGDMAGVGSLLLAQEQVKEVVLTGCSPQFAAAFSTYGICQHCAGQDPHCAWRLATNKLPA